MIKCILKMKKNFIILTLSVVLLIFSGCGKIPQAEIDAAKAAIENAKVSQADLFLESDFLALQDSLNAAVAVVEAQKSKVFGGFSEVKSKLSDISTKAAELVTKTETRKEEIKGEITAAQASVAALLEENVKLLGSAPKGKEGKEALEAIKLDIEGISSSVAEVPALLSGGDILSAHTKIKAAQEKATEINTELKTVLDKYLSKK